MLRGFYTSANAIINENRILNVLSNNIANVKTAGYKADEVIPTTFAESMLLINGESSETGTIRYRTLQDTYTSLEQGTMENTNSALDMAIIGSVYFNIENDVTGEVLLTKNGQFDIDDEGCLELGNSGRVLDENGNYIPVGTSNFDLYEDGTIVTADGREFRLGLTYIDPTADVEKVGDNFFRPYNGEAMGNIPEDYGYRLRQGWIERSNVNVADQMVRIMDENQVFNANTQAMKILNSINQIACNDLMKKGM